MTQAFNLSQLANNLNSSGQLDATDGLNGLVPLTNGGTGSTNTVNTVVAGTGISVSTSGTEVTINTTGSGTVTSVSTGNGLQGGPITTSGTLSVACPSFNSVGSYCWGNISTNSVTSGSNYSAGSSGSTLQCLITRNNGDLGLALNATTSNILSGTWKWMGQSHTDDSGRQLQGLICRVS